MKKSFVKALTLIFFAGMLVSFLLFRTGKFDNLFSAGTNDMQQSPNGGPLKALRLDTTKPPVKIFRRKTRAMSSSKVLVVTDDWELQPAEAWNDSTQLAQTIKKLNKEQWIKTDSLKIDTMQRSYLGGSKSSAVFIPGDFSNVEKYLKMNKPKKKQKQIKKTKQ